MSTTVLTYVKPFADLDRHGPSSPVDVAIIRLSLAETDLLPLILLVSIPASVSHTGWSHRVINKHVKTPDLP